MNEAIIHPLDYTTFDSSATESYSASYATHEDELKNWWEGFGYFIPRSEWSIVQLLRVFRVGVLDTRSFKRRTRDLE